MVIDTSAIIAILGGESEAEDFQRIVAAADRTLISTATLLETKIVANALGVAPHLDRWLAVAEIGEVPFSNEHCLVAERAYLQFGKGRHPAGLNFGDCFAYALAKTLDAPLLFKGDVFSRTDIRPACQPSTPPEGPA